MVVDGGFVLVFPVPVNWKVVPKAKLGSDSDLTLLAGISSRGEGLLLA